MKRIRSRARQAFTLVEVILAILIISAIMSVLFYFYQRSVEVRRTVLEEVEFLSVSRMVMEQITGELRSARLIEDQFVGFEGASNSITFVCTAIPPSPRWIISTNEAVIVPPVTDLKRVHYGLLTGTNATHIRGLDRTEEWVTTSAFTLGTNSTDFLNTSETNFTSQLDGNVFEVEQEQPVRPPLTDRIKYLQFRYWSGTNWIESWSGLELPAGVEITISKDPLLPEQSASLISSTADDFPIEIFRRVVSLPGSIPPANRIAPSDPEESLLDYNASAR